MTNKEALVGVVRVSVPDHSLEKAMIDNDVTGGSTYVKLNEKSIDLCAIDVLQGLLSEPNVSEGGYSISYDRKAVLDRLNYLNQKHGLVDAAKPTVTSKSPW
jgi:hypothetical protein